MTPIVAWGEQTGKCEDDCVGDIERGANLVMCNQSSREFVARVRAILRWKELETRRSLLHVAGGVQMDMDRHKVRINGELVELTPNEFQILRPFLEPPSLVFPARKCSTASGEKAMRSKSMPSMCMFTPCGRGSKAIPPSRN